MSGIVLVGLVFGLSVVQVECSIPLVCLCRISMFGNWPVTVARCDRADMRDAGLPIITVNSSLNDIDAYVRLGFLDPCKLDGPATIYCNGFHDYGERMD